MFRNLCHFVKISQKGMTHDKTTIRFQRSIRTASICDAQLTIDVRDFGIGFDQKKHIIQAFKRGGNTKSTSGLGLGLYISQDILQRYHGSLTIETQQPGSLVSLSIPLSIPSDSE